MGASASTHNATNMPLCKTTSFARRVHGAPQGAERGVRANREYFRIAPSIGPHIDQLIGIDPCPGTGAPYVVWYQPSRQQKCRLDELSQSGTAGDGWCPTRRVTHMKGGCSFLRALLICE